MMQPWHDVTDVRRVIMRANKGKNTKPEVTVRRLLHAMGYRFRIHRRDLPGTPDIVFPGRRKAIQIHGCFWHQHEGCRHGRMPVTRQHYWMPKFARNKERDRQVEAALAALDWDPTTIWECELGDMDRLADRLQTFLGPGGANKGKPGLPRAVKP